jgi:hypothetical protein
MRQALGSRCGTPLGRGSGRQKCQSGMSFAFNYLKHSFLFILAVRHGFLTHWNLLKK